MGKELWKIVLQPDGSWQHVYREVEDFKPLDGHGLAALYSKKQNDPRSLEDLREDIIELALEHSDYEESKIVLEHVMRK
jgi:hypothetical protein